MWKCENMKICGDENVRRWKYAHLVVFQISRNSGDSGNIKYGSSLNIANGKRICMGKSCWMPFKPSSHIVFGSIGQYSTVLQYPRATIWKHSDQILNTVKYPQYRQILGTANRRWIVLFCFASFCLSFVVVEVTLGPTACESNLAEKLSFAPKRSIDSVVSSLRYTIGNDRRYAWAHSQTAPGF